MQNGDIYICINSISVIYTHTLWTVPTGRAHMQTIFTHAWLPANRTRWPINKNACRLPMSVEGWEFDNSAESNQRLRECVLYHSYLAWHLALNGTCKRSRVWKPSEPNQRLTECVLYHSYLAWHLALNGTCKMSRVWKSSETNQRLTEFVLYHSCLAWHLAINGTCNKMSRVWIPDQVK